MGWLSRTHLHYTCFPICLVLSRLGCGLTDFFPGCFSGIPDRAHQSCLLSALHALASLTRLKSTPCRVNPDGFHAGDAGDGRVGAQGQTGGWRG